MNTTEITRLRKKNAQLITALSDCVAIMENELEGLKSIGPELKQAKEALAATMNPFQSSLSEIVAAMAIYGGGFVMALGEAMRHANSEKLERIIEAFPEIISDYDGMATNQREVAP